MSAKKLLTTKNREINDIFFPYWDFLSKASHSPQKYVETLSTEDFIKFVSLRNHKSRGTDVENRIAFRNQWKKVGRAEESGDLMDIEGKYVEVKSSIVTPNAGSRVTLRGFRNWEQNIHYYIAVILDIRDFRNNPASYIFKIPRSCINFENKFKPFNQSRLSRAENKNIPLGISFDIGDKTFAQWEISYKTDAIFF